MAKGKYEYWLTEEGLLKLEGWARNGLPDRDIAGNMGVSRDTLIEWKKKYPDISDTLKRTREVVDTRVENALYKKALGHTETVKKPVKVRTVFYENGRKVREEERVEYADEEVYVPPDTTADIFWLKNRCPEKWRDRQEVQMDAGIHRLEDLL